MFSERLTTDSDLRTVSDVQLENKIRLALSKIKIEEAGTITFYSRQLKDRKEKKGLEYIIKHIASPYGISLTEEESNDLLPLHQRYFKRTTGQPNYLTKYVTNATLVFYVLCVGGNALTVMSSSQENSSRQSMFYNFVGWTIAAAAMLIYINIGVMKLQKEDQKEIFGDEFENIQKLCREYVDFKNEKMKSNNYSFSGLTLKR